MLKEECDKIGCIMVIFLHCILSFLSVLLNAFGIYCLHKKTSRNRNQEVLLQNLSATEILKVSFDFVSLIVFHCCRKWYDHYFMYLDIAEVCFMTALYSAFMFICVERLLCIGLSTSYKQLITTKLVKTGVALSWLVACIPGVLMWMLRYRAEHHKAYYYVSLDAVVTLLIVATYSTFLYHFGVGRNRKEIISHRSGGNLSLRRMLTVSSAIFATFVLFNVIPDVVFACRKGDDAVYHLMALLWNVGYISDPLLYVFLNKRCRSMAYTYKEDLQRGLSECISSDRIFILRKGLDETARLLRIMTVRISFRRELEVEVDSDENP